MTTGKLRKLYEHPLFHGIKTEAEALNICKAEIEQFGKPGARTNPDGTHFEPKNTYIWFLLEEEEYHSAVVYRYCDSSEVPFERVVSPFGAFGFSPEELDDFLLTKVS